LVFFEPQRRSPSFRKNVVLAETENGLSRADLSSIVGATECPN
jgi:hypothetical protein